MLDATLLLSLIAMALTMAWAFAYCNMPMRNISDLIENLGGSAAVAGFLKKPQPTICSWMARNSIPYHHWKRVIDLAHRRGLKKFRMEQLWELQS